MPVDSIKSAMMRDMLLIDSVSRNMANLQTDGFKREIAIAESMALTQMSEQHSVNVFNDFSAGAHQNTGRALDLALMSGGFFVVENDAGERFYTRKGSFSVDEAGLLKLGNFKVMGVDGEIRLSSSDVKILDDGVISHQGTDVAKLLVAEITDTSNLQYQENSLFSSDSVSLMDDDGVQVLSGWLEASNVNMTQEMLLMMEANRRFEGTSKVLQTYDAMLDVTINTLADY